MLPTGRETLVDQKVLLTCSPGRPEPPPRQIQPCSPVPSFQVRAFLTTAISKNDVELPSTRSVLQGHAHDQPRRTDWTCRPRHIDLDLLRSRDNTRFLERQSHLGFPPYYTLMRSRCAGPSHTHRRPRRVRAFGGRRCRNARHAAVSGVHTVGASGLDAHADPGVAICADDPPAPVLDDEACSRDGRAG